MAKRPCLKCGAPSVAPRCPTCGIRRDRSLALRFLDAIYTRDEGVCHLCGELTPRREATLDHVVPLSKGGSDHHTNLRLAHRSCNSGRGDTDLAVYDPTRRFR